VTKKALEQFYTPGLFLFPGHFIKTRHYKNTSLRGGTTKQSLHDRRLRDSHACTSLLAT